MLPFLAPPAIPNREVNIELNNRVVAKWRFDQSAWQSRRLVLPPGLDGGSVQLSFVESETRSPANLKISSEPSHLGLAVKTLTLRQTPE
jgi:hypothetical protein